MGSYGWALWLASGVDQVRHEGRGRGSRGARSSRGAFLTAHAADRGQCVPRPRPGTYRQARADHAWRPGGQPHDHGRPTDRDRAAAPGRTVVPVGVPGPGGGHRRQRHRRALEGHRPFLVGPLGRNGAGASGRGQRADEHGGGGRLRGRGRFRPRCHTYRAGAVQGSGVPAGRRGGLGAPPPTMAEFAQLFPDAEFVVQSGAGHFPWLDDAAWSVTATAGFLE